MTAKDEKTALVPQPCELSCSYSRTDDLEDPDSSVIFWTSIFPNRLVIRHSSEIHKLRWVLRVIRLFLPFFYCLKVSWMLKLFRFSPDFGREIIFPLILYSLKIKDDYDVEKLATCGMLYRIFASGSVGRDV